MVPELLPEGPGNTEGVGGSGIEDDQRGTSDSRPGWSDGRQEICVICP